MATAKPLTRRPAAGYDEDYYAWTQAQAAALRRLAADGRELPLDLLNLAEEVEDLGRSTKHAVRSQVTRLLVHFLKLAYSPALDPRDLWLDTVDHARAEIQDLATATIRRELTRELPKLYARARREAARAIGQYGEAATLPETCPYTLDQLFDDGWYPEPVTPPAAPPGT
jgi:hypothetical protein